MLHVCLLAVLGLFHATTPTRPSSHTGPTASFVLPAPLPQRDGRHKTEDGKRRPRLLVKETRFTYSPERIGG